MTLAEYKALETGGWFENVKDVQGQPPESEDKDLPVTEESPESEDKGPIFGEGKPKPSSKKK